MSNKILKCQKCLGYTLKPVCISCDIKTINIKPAKFSIDDKYGHYRRIMRNELQAQTNK